MQKAEIRQRFLDLERKFLTEGNPPKFAATCARKQVVEELDALGNKRFESIFLLYEAMESDNAK